MSLARYSLTGAVPQVELDTSVYYVYSEFLLLLPKTIDPAIVHTLLPDLDHRHTIDH